MIIVAAPNPFLLIFTGLNYEYCMPVTILGIESSCDETGAAVLIDGQIVANCIANQSIHELYGGVVPELASRAHQANIVPVVEIALKKAGITLQQIDAVAFTQGPGLLGSLMVGAGYAKGVSLALDIPLIAVHHMQAHILAHFVEDPKPDFPFLCLTVSGGHTQLVLVKSHLDMEIIGQTTDDAAGEAFDKCAKMLGLPYPGGPLIDKLAQQGNPLAFTFAEPKIPGLDFSFSGFKTSVLYFLQEQIKSNPNFIQENMNNLCAAIQHSIVEILVRKMRKAARQYGVKQIAIAGGVSANSCLRNKIIQLGKSEGYDVFIPAFEYCTDNAAMIAITGYYKFLIKQFADQTIVPAARITGLTN
ncbi:MAG: tRNA (adenosine(37)-N6)-threonylcarbamoyltransferase complex transferase subunit TsaD [Chitinophagales bacterium]